MKINLMHTLQQEEKQANKQKRKELTIQKEQTKGAIRTEKKDIIKNKQKQNHAQHCCLIVVL